MSTRGLIGVAFATCSVAATPLLGFAVGCSSKGNAPSVEDPGSGGAGGGVSRGGGGGGSDAGGDAAPDVATDAAEAMDAMDATDAMTDVAPPRPACSQRVRWKAGALIPSASSGGDDVLGSITPDELSIAWIEVAGGSPLVHYADRSKPREAFAPFSTLPPHPGYYPLDRVALSTNGLRLVVVSSSGATLAEVTRARRGMSFSSSPDSAPFVAVNKALDAGERIGDPVLSFDDRTLYFTRSTGAGTGTVWSATRATAADAWSLDGPVRAKPATLDVVGGKRRRPTGVSRDGLTLFYFDEDASLSRAVWRKTLAGSFDEVVDIGGWFGAQPSTSCLALYYSSLAPSPRRISISIPK